MTTITGHVNLVPAPARIDNAVLTVKLENASLADAPSNVIASATQQIETNDIKSLSFELSPEAEVDANGSYVVSAHLSLHPDDNPDEIRTGDYLTMQSYPVLTQGYASTVDIEVKRIG